MDLGIYLLSYNRLDDLKFVIKQLLALDKNQIKEIIILDQGSTDGSKEYLMALNEPRIDVLFSKENLGVAGGRHYLMERSTANLCLFLDDDSYLLDDSIGKIKQEFKQDCSLDFVSLNIVDIDGKLKDWPHSRRLKKRWLDSWTAMNFVGCGHAIKRDTYLKVGGYSTRDMFYAEELDLAYKFFAHRRALSGKYCGELKVVHLASAKSRIHWSGQRLVYRVKNRLTYYLASFSLLSPLTWVFVLGFLFSDLLLALKNKNMKGFFSGLKLVEFSLRSRCSLFLTLKYQILHIKSLLGYGF